MAVLTALVAPEFFAGADVMWMLVAAVVALLAVPGLALFYGGMARVGKSSRMMVLSSVALMVIGIVWATLGRGLVFGAPLIPGLVGNPVPAGAPVSVFGALAADGFCVVSAVVAVAIIGAAVASRVRVRGWVVFVAAWMIMVFLPVLYWILNEDDGWAAGMRVADLAGGAFVQVSAAAAALALLLVLGVARPAASGVAANRSMLFAGAALIWVGWIGLNVAAEGVFDDMTGLILANTLVAPAAGMLGWILADKLSTGRITKAGPASGAVSGLVAIAPGCASFDPGWGIALGLLAGAVCAFATLAGRRRGYTGSFRIVAIHLVAGVTGMLYIGIFGSEVGFIYNGNPAQSIAQAATVLAVGVYSFAVSWLIVLVIRKTMGLSTPSFVAALAHEPERVE